MRVTTFAAAAAFAVHASSFLVPIEIADAVEKATDEVNSVFSTSQRKLELDCPECWSSAVVPKDAAVGAANADAKLVRRLYITKPPTGDADHDIGCSIHTR